MISHHFAGTPPSWFNCGTSTSTHTHKILTRPPTTTDPCLILLPCLCISALLSLCHSPGCAVGGCWHTNVGFFSGALHYTPTHSPEQVPNTISGTFNTMNVEIVFGAVWRLNNMFVAILNSVLGRVPKCACGTWMASVNVQYAHHGFYEIKGPKENHKLF